MIEKLVNQSTGKKINIDELPQDDGKTGCLRVYFSLIFWVTELKPILLKIYHPSFFIDLVSIPNL